jgi:hypothetical protein
MALGACTVATKRRCPRIYPQHALSSGRRGLLRPTPLDFSDEAAKVENKIRTRGAGGYFDLTDAMQTKARCA